MYCVAYPVCRGREHSQYGVRSRWPHQMLGLCSATALNRPCSESSYDRSYVLCVDWDVLLGWVSSRAKLASKADASHTRLNMVGDMLCEVYVT